VLEQPDHFLIDPVRGSKHVAAQRITPFFTRRKVTGGCTYFGDRVIKSITPWAGM